MIIRDILKLFLILILITNSGLVHAQDPNLDVSLIQKAQLLIESGKSEEAYELLEPLELEEAGNVQYDYLLGISELNSGKASRAVFALERVLETDAGYGDTPLWLAIAYYRSGDKERAISGFNAVLATSQNTRSKARANEYLASINNPEAPDDINKKDANTPYLLGKWEAGVGYDDNISNNSSNNLGSTQLSNTLPVPVSNLGGMEAILNLGIEGRVPIARNYAFVSVDDGLRKYRGNAIMNSETLTTKGGVNITSEEGDVYRVNLAMRRFYQQGFAEGVKDIDNDYDIKGLEGYSKLKISGHDYFGLLAQYNQLHFVANSLEDTHQVMLGANYMHIFQIGGAPVFYFGYTNIADKAVQMKPAYAPTYNNGMTDAGRVSKNYTLYLQYSISKNVDLFSADNINFRRDTGAFARDSIVAIGEDKTSYMSIGLNWRPHYLWTVGVQVAKTWNVSNIFLYSYDKTESRITLKREFNSL